MQVAAVRRTMK